MDTLNYQISFILHTSAYPDSEFKVVEFEGVEEISRPYRYEILFSHSESDLDLDAFLNQTATLKTDRNGEEYDVHGVLLEAELISETAAHDFLYRVMLVPRFALMDYSTQNQVYQNQTVAEIIEQEIQAAGGKAGTAAQTIQLTPNDYRMDLTRSDYPSREYVVQYRETDFNFINRLMEHEGIFYFFEQDEGGERIVFADDNIKCPKIHEEEFEVPLQLDNGLMVFDEMTIKRFRGKSVSIPRKVLLKDYNYRAPHVSLQAEHDIDQACVGLQYYYGEHFKTPQEGDCLARVRSEEHQLKKHQFSGNSDCVHFHPGHFFSLNDHYNE
ncbi:MAG: type VI secretion system tip protein VgrG, partial [Gammaproteobacteria bacterium]|nr:type VI secretion system tip protein VgrG [Gammaproteobacteria bacterium]